MGGLTGWVNYEGGWTKGGWTRRVGGLTGWVD